MRFHLFVCMVLTLMCRGFTRDIASQMNDKTLNWTRLEEIEYTPGRLKRAYDSRKFLCNPPLLPWRNVCYEAYRQGPCQQGSFISPPIGEAEAHCVENPCWKNGWTSYNGTCHALGSRGPCAPNRVLGVDGTTFNLECIRDDARLFLQLLAHRFVPRSGRTMNVVRKHKLRPKLKRIIEAPVIGSKRQKCPPGRRRSITGVCRVPMSDI